MKGGAAGGLFHPPPSMICTRLGLTCPPPPPLSARRVRDGLSGGVIIHGVETKGRLEGCEISGNKMSGVQITAGANPAVVSCR